MTIEDALFAKLSSVAGITALVSTRIYPDTAPQGAAQPFLIYRQSGRSDRACLSGERSGIVTDEFDLMAEGLDRAALSAIRDAVQAALDGTTARGLWGGVSGVNVRGCLVDTAIANKETPPESSEDHRRELVLSLTVIWKR